MATKGSSIGALCPRKGAMPAVALRPAKRCRCCSCCCCSCCCTSCCLCFDGYLKSVASSRLRKGSGSGLGAISLQKVTSFSMPRVSAKPGGRAMPSKAQCQQAPSAFGKAPCLQAQCSESGAKPRGTIPVLTSLCNTVAAMSRSCCSYCCFTIATAVATTHSCC